MSNSDLEGFESPLLDVRPVERTCYIVVGADKGLAGAFSSNVLKFAMEELKGKDPSTYRVITAGRKPRDSMKSRGIHIDKSYAGFSMFNALALSREARKRRIMPDHGFIYGEKYIS